MWLQGMFNTNQRFMFCNTSSQVKWGMSNTFDYPMSLLLIFMDMEKMIGVEYEKSLQNLKGVLEK